MLLSLTSCIMGRHTYYMETPRPNLKSFVAFKISAHALLALRSCSLSRAGRDVDMTLLEAAESSVFIGAFRSTFELCTPTYADAGSAYVTCACIQTLAELKIKTKHEVFGTFLPPLPLQERG